MIQHNKELFNTKLSKLSRLNSVLTTHTLLSLSQVLPRLSLWIGSGERVPRMRARAADHSLSLQALEK